MRKEILPSGNDSTNEERSMTDTVVKRHHFACTLCAMEPCLSEHRNAGARKMTLLPMFRSLSVNQGCVQRDRFLNSLADW